jgi:hypothetical protein
VTDSDQPREPEGEAALDAEAFHRWIDAAGEHLGIARLLVEEGGTRMRFSWQNSPRSAR